VFELGFLEPWLFLDLFTARLVMTMRALRLRDDLRISIVHRDDTRFGSALTGLIDQLVRLGCRSVLEAGALDRAEASAGLTDCFGAGALGQLYERPDRLREDCLYPDARLVTPARLVVHRPAAGPPRACPVPASLWAELARWLGDWRRPSTAPQDFSARTLWNALVDAKAMTAAPAREPKALPQLTTVGHATVVLCDGEGDGATRLLFDPFFVPAGSENGYRPLSAAELDADAVFVTHSHGDHYDFGSLLQLGADTPIYVPAVERESLLALDMAGRLRSLGFRQVHELQAGDLVQVGTWRVEAQLMLGEQPSDGEVLHGECRNVGLVYLASTPRRRFALLADAGADQLGSCLELAQRMRARSGPIDALLTGFRGWTLRPAQLLDSSVARYLLFVPRDQWGRRYRIMNDAQDVVAIARAWGANVVIPYANGGAPWFWEMGLGPRLDARGGPVDVDFDPDLEPLMRAVADDAKQGPTLRVLSMHPGEGVDLGRESKPREVIEPGWPFLTDERASQGAA
jgi:L-ascorbate metabolism protein UlaG (beta-lactamase superfamily)